MVQCVTLLLLLLLLQEHKVLLTGTPLQNTVEELFSLLNFLEPDRFPSENTFMAEFGDLKTEEQVGGGAGGPPWGHLVCPGPDVGVCCGPDVSLSWSRC